VVGERNGSSGDGGEGGGAFRLPRHEDNEWRQRLACRASSGTTIEDRAATYADRAVTVPPHAKSLAKLRRALAQRNARRARGEDPIEPEKLTSVKAVALKLGASTVGTAFSPNKVHELQWSKYGSQYRMNAEEQRKKKLDEANELRLEREAKAALPSKEAGVNQFRHYMLPVFRCLWRFGEIIFPFFPIFHSGGYVYRFIQGKEGKSFDLEEPAFINAVCDLMQNQRICTMFNAADTDGSGGLSRDELANVVTMLQLAEDKHSLESMMTGMDLDHNARVDLWEFCVYLQRSLNEHKSDIAVIHEDEWKLEMSLELFDANKDGFVTADELARIMQDGHGGLDDDEFAIMVQVLGLQDGGKMTMEAMRQHECWAHLGGLFDKETAMEA